MTTQKMFATVALGAVPGFSGTGEGTVQLQHVRRAGLDPDRSQRE